MHNYLRSVTEIDCPASFFVKYFNKVSHTNPKRGGADQHRHRIQGTRKQKSDDDS